MIELIQVSKSYGSKQLFKDFSLKIQPKEFVTITGNSGSGKTTLLNVMGLLEKVDSGTVTIQNVKNPDWKTSQKLRRYSIGYIFQNFALLENETVRKNLDLSTKYNKNYTEEALYETLEEVGLSIDILKKKVYELSGGEQQRIAIARTMIKPCDIIFADEPTGNLDSYNKGIIIGLLKKLNFLGKTIVCVTHDQDVAASSDRTINIPMN
ncbi:ATP-binding cassette domain-containing protein [Bacillus sp. RC]|nr:ATP-binding cassette domain-containing protein [Bacillus sp. RC]